MIVACQQNIVGVDIGGANIKYASVVDRASSRNFALWMQSGQLGKVLATDLRSLGEIDVLAVTMTGEMADCFRDRSAGVHHILDATSQAAKEAKIKDVWFYGVDGKFRTADDAKKNVHLIAAANWHALASFVARTIVSCGTLVDIGSTTTDLIPLVDGRVATEAKTDHQRLVERSLVYVGCRRTAVCALLSELTFRGKRTPVMNEWFATIDDARLVMGCEPEDAEDCDSADHQPRTAMMAANRLARMIGLDHLSVEMEEARDLAAQVIEAAKQSIRAAFEEIDRKHGAVVLCGHGSDLLDLRPLLDGESIREVIDLSSLLGVELSRCGPSYAVAKLWADQRPGGGF